MIPSDVIKLDKNTKTFFMPTLLLMSRDFSPLGKISKYYNWNISLKANSIDEISFDVNKFYYDEYGNKIICPVWDDLIDLKIVDVDGLGKFEISVTYTDNTETIKSVHGESLEVELGQLYLNDFHVNDEEAISGDITEYNKMHFDADGNFIPTKFYDPSNTPNSLLHRVLADKAPHWKIGYVTPYVSISEDDKAELSSEFVRTYTVDGTSIYDFLTDEVAKETNVVFLFDTNTRTINCYSLIDCYIDGELVASAIGEDTNILISKKKLANEIGIETNKDEIKNCFRVSGGDDLITSQVAAVNMTGSNYIYQFADFQIHDMPSELQEKLTEYQRLVDSKKDIYYGEDGIYPRLCDAYEEYNTLKYTMMPASTLVETSAEEQYYLIVNGFYNASGRTLPYYLKQGVGMYTDSFDTATSNNNVLAMAEVYVDSRYKVSQVGNGSYANNTWTGQIKVTRVTDETDSFPKLETSEDPSIPTLTSTFNVPLLTDADDFIFTKQKLEKALAKNDLTQTDAGFNDTGASDSEIIEHFNLYCLDMLKSFRDAYETCVSELTDIGKYSSSEPYKQLYEIYQHRFALVDSVYQERLQQVNSKQEEIDSIKIEQADIQKQLNFPNFLGDLYIKFCAYVREDDYSNSNYISDNLSSTAEYLDKAKELLDVATAQLKKACVIQRTVNTSLNNLLLLPEFEPLYDSFNLFNYIRVVCEDEMFKLRIMEISADGDNYSDINVTFAEKIETLDSNITDIQSILAQASSIASSYDATMLQAKQGKNANNIFDDISENGLNTGEYVLKNENNDELVISAAGLIARKMTDVGSYSPEQLKITGNGIYLTKDNWQTFQSAVGTVYSENENGYGITADSVIGKFILGENLEIDSQNSNIKIGNDGIVVTNGTYTVSLNPSSDINNKIFRIYKTEGTDETDIMHVSNQGKGYFNGDLQAGSVISVDDDYYISPSQSRNEHFGCFIDVDGDGIIYRTQPTDDGRGTLHDITTSTFKVNNEGFSYATYWNMYDTSVSPSEDIAFGKITFNSLNGETIKYEKQQEGTTGWYIDSLGEIYRSERGGTFYNVIEAGARNVFSELNLPNTAGTYKLKVTQNGTEPPEYTWVLA